MSIEEIRILLLFIVSSLLAYITIQNKREIKMLKRYILLIDEDLEEMQE